MSKKPNIPAQFAVAYGTAESNLTAEEALAFVGQALEAVGSAPLYASPAEAKAANVQDPDAIVFELRITRVQETF